MRNITNTIALVVALSSVSAVAVKSMQTSPPPVPPGTVVAFAGLGAPGGWMICDGRALNGRLAANKELYKMIGTYHGDGTTGIASGPRTNFNLPDYRGMFLRGVTGGSTNDPDTHGRSAPAPGGKSGNHVGSVQGDMYGSHTHSHGSSEHNGAIVASPRSMLAGGNINHANGAFAIHPSGGNETRPKNAYVTYIIKL